MNIEQIAHEVAVEIDPLQRKLQGDFQFSEKQLSEFLRRCLNKLAEQEVEQPVAYTCNYAFYRLKPCSSINGQPFIPLYTEAQLLSAQQRTAEACAESVRDAARYRYLREWWFCGPEGSIRNALYPDELDAEIDAAIGKEK